MENGLKEINSESLEDNVFKTIGEDWMLITAGTIDCFNTMTASWVRFFTLSFFDEARLVIECKKDILPGYRPGVFHGSGYKRALSGE